MPPAQNQSRASALHHAFVGCVLCLAVFQFSENTADPDLWGHVLFGRELLQSGRLLTAEPYSWTASGHEWINHENIAEIVLAAAHRALGGAGLLLLKILVGLLTFHIAIRTARKPGDGKSSALAWAVGALAVVEISFGFAARPQIFTALALAIEFWLLRQIHAGRWRWAFALPLLFAVWINTHGGALAGIVLLFLAAVATTAQEWFRKRAAHLTPRRLALPVAPATPVLLWFFAISSATALLVNPYGMALLRWLAGSVLWLRPEIQEWNPAAFGGDHAAFFVCLAAAAGSFVLSRRPLALWEVAVTAALAFMALRSMRHTPLFCLAALAFVPPHFADALHRFRGHFRHLTGLGRRTVGQWLLTTLLALTSAGILYATFTRHKERAWTLEVPRSQYPVAALDFIKQHELRGNLLVFFDWGEQCLWELPDSRVSLDGRLDTCYPRNVIAAHWNLYNGDSFDEVMLPVDRADFALLPMKLAGAHALARQRGWQAVYVDDLAVVLVRDVKQFPKLAWTSLPVTGPAASTKGRAAFPDRPSLRLSSKP